MDQIHANKQQFHTHSTATNWEKNGSSKNTTQNGGVTNIKVPSSFNEPVYSTSSNAYKYQKQSSNLQKPKIFSNIVSGGGGEIQGISQNGFIAKAGEQISQRKNNIAQFPEISSSSSSQNQPSNLINKLFNSPPFGNELNLQQNQPTGKSIQELQQEVAFLKREMIKQAKEKDEQISILRSENNQLVRQMKHQSEMIHDLKQNLERSRKDNEQRHERKRQEREQAELERQYAFMLAMEQMEEAQMPQNNSQNPNVDNMTYEELINLQDQIGFVSKGMKEEDVNKILELKYNMFSMKDNVMCSICQCNFEHHEKVKKLKPCSHLYHSDCINQWLKNEKTCPICKQTIAV